MATYTAIFVPAKPLPTKVSALAASTSSAELVFSNYAILAISATGDCHVAFGNSGMADAATTGWRITSGAVHQFELSGAYDRIKIFNPNAGAIDVYVMPLARS